MSSFCYSDAAPDLEHAARDTAAMQAWVKGKTEAQLLEALDLIYVHHYVPRGIVQGALATIRHQQLTSRLAELQKPHWSVIWTFWLVIIGIAVALFAWLLPR